MLDMCGAFSQHGMQILLIWCMRIQHICQHVGVCVKECDPSPSTCPCSHFFLSVWGLVHTPPFGPAEKGCNWEQRAEVQSVRESACYTGSDTGQRRRRRRRRMSRAASNAAKAMHQSWACQPVKRASQSVMESVSQKQSSESGRDESVITAPSAPSSKCTYISKHRGGTQDKAS